jgi:hypothetical protein
LIIALQIALLQFDHAGMVSQNHQKTANVLRKYTFIGLVLGFTGLFRVLQHGFAPLAKPCQPGARH